MTAFFIATVTIKNAEKFGEYAAKTPGTFAPFGGELLVRGKMDEALVGQADNNAAAVISFPDMESLKAWYHSPAYQALAPLRDSAADMTIVSYQVPA